MRLVGAWILTTAIGCARGQESESSGERPQQRPENTRLTGHASIGVNWNQACAVDTKGAVMCWGEAYPTALLPRWVDLQDAVDVEIYQSRACALQRAGTVVCWDGEETPEVVAGVRDVEELALGSGGWCARLEGGRIVCGRGSEADSSAPAIDDAIDIDGGQGFCAVRRSGSVTCWGGILGSLGFDHRAPPADLGLQGVEEVAVGDWHICVRRRDSTVGCLGANSSGQLGDGTSTSSTTLITPKGLGQVESLDACCTRTIARGVDGRIHWWGDPTHAVASDGASSSSVPVVVEGATNLVDVETGISFACGRSQAGVVSCWGDNSDGELGDGTTTNRNSPVHVLSPPQRHPTELRQEAEALRSERAKVESIVAEAAPPKGLPLDVTSVEVSHDPPSDAPNALSIRVAYHANAGLLQLYATAHCRVGDETRHVKDVDLQAYRVNKGEDGEAHHWLFVHEDATPAPPDRCQLSLYVMDRPFQQPEVRTELGRFCWDGTTTARGRCVPSLE